MVSIETMIGHSKTGENLPRAGVPEIMLPLATETYYSNVRVSAPLLAFSAFGVRV